MRHTKGYAAELGSGVLVRHDGSDLSGRIDEIQSRLAECVGRRHAVLTGTGTAALAIACQLTPPERPRILIPAICCPQVLFAVFYAGKVPVLVDITDRDATIDPSRVADLLDADPGIGAVIAVHLYGHRANIDGLLKLAAEKNVRVIEDAAQAFGGRHPDGQKFGAVGDLSVTSFGHSKILDVGGGGLLLTDDDDLAASARARAQQLPLVAEAVIAQQAKNYSRIYYAVWNAALTDEKFLSVFDSFPALFQNRFINAITGDLAEKISASIPGLERELEHRRALYAAYLEAFRAMPSVKTFQVDPQSIAPWRFSCRIPVKFRDQVLSEVRNEGYDASAWYPDLSMWSLAERHRAVHSRPVAEAIEREVVNFWLTSNVSQNDVAKISQVVLRVLGGVNCDKHLLEPI